MKVFNHFNTTTIDSCPVCHTKDDKKTVLIGIDGTEDEGIMKAAQVHLDCIELQYREDPGVFYQRVKP